MDVFEDYYEILQVHPSAEPEVIEAAYKKLASKYHPDRNPSPAAPEKMKKINLAHDVLADPEQRARYDIEWSQNKDSTAGSAKDRALAKPKPIFEPICIEFKNVKAGEVKKASFLIFNAGGSYSRVSIDSSESWLMITDYTSLTPSDELPLKVNIQALATNWNTTYSGSIKVELDKSKAILPVKLQTRMRLLVKDHRWHDMDYDNLRDWVKTPQNKAKLDAGVELPGKIFRYRLNRSTGKYQIRLRNRHNSGIYAPP